MYAEITANKSSACVKYSIDLWFEILYQVRRQSLTFIIFINDHNGPIIEHTLWSKKNKIVGRGSYFSYKHFLTSVRSISGFVDFF